MNAQTPLTHPRQTIMRSLVDLALVYKRTVLMLMLLLAANGVVAYFSIPKEESPDVNFPALYITTTLSGISAQDADRLIVTPITRELQGLDGLKEISSTAAEGYGGILLEFDSGIDIDTVMPDVREKVDSAKADLPQDAEEPDIAEFNVALFPVMSIALSGDVDERILFDAADQLQDLIEAVEEVLEVNINGKRDDLAEVVIDPNKLEAHDLSLEEIIDLSVNNNQLIAAGAIDTGQGLLSVKVPGLIESEQDILSLPIKRSGEKVITFEDVAWGQLTYTDPSSYARFNNQRTVVLDVSKRIGANLLSMVEKIKFIIEERRDSLPDGLDITYTLDQSIGVQESLSSLFNNVVAATLLVIIVAMVALGVRSSLLIGVNIPMSFLIALMVINMLGFTLNIVVFFALILERRDAGRRRYCGNRICRHAHVARREQTRGLPRGLEAHGLADNRLDRDHAGSIFSAAILAGHHRRIHGLHPDYGADNAHRLPSHGAGGVAGNRLDLRQAQ